MTALDALQLALAGEHAAVFGYGVVGARGVPSDAALALASYTVHRRRRDRLTALVRSLGATPVPAKVGYRLPDSVRGRRAVRELARRIEERGSAQYAFVVSQTRDGVRRFAANALTDCAVRGLRWGASSEPFPGADDP